MLVNCKGLHPERLDISDRNRVLANDVRARGRGQRDVNQEEGQYGCKRGQTFAAP